MSEGNLPVTILVQGGIASGKSTIAKMIADRGGAYVDCDRIAHGVLDEEAVREALREAFGAGIFAEDGSVARPALAEVVFTDEEALARLEAIVHPRVVAHVEERIQAGRTPSGEPRKVLVIDAAVASRMKLASGFELTLFVDTDAETRKRRTIEQRGWDPGELERREARQAPLDSKRSQADAVVRGDGELEEAKAHVERFWTEFVGPRV